MATSGTYTFNPTVAEILNDALQICGHDLYTPPEPEVMEMAKRTLNVVIQDLNEQSTDVYAIVVTTLETVAGDGEYDLPAGAVGIDGMTINADDKELDIKPLTFAEFAAVRNDDNEGIPAGYYLDKQAGVIHLRSIPNDVYTITYRQTMKYQDAGEDENNVSLQARAAKMLILKTALLMSHKPGFAIADKSAIILDARDAESRYRVFSSGYTRGQVSTSAMVV